MLAEAGIEPAWADFQSTNLYIQISNLSSFQFCKCFISICLNVKVIKGLMLRCGTDFTPHSSVPWTIQRSSISETDVPYRLTAELLLSARSSLSKVSTKPRAIQLLIIENSQEGSARPRYDEFNENDNARVWSINTQSSFCGPDSFHLFDLCHASLRNCLAVKAIGERTIDECQNCCQQHCSGFRAAG